MSIEIFSVLNAERAKKRKKEKKNRFVTNDVHESPMISLSVTIDYEIFIIFQFNLTSTNSGVYLIERREHL